MAFLGAAGVLLHATCTTTDVDTTGPIPDAPACTSCRIEPELIARLGEADGPGALANVSQVAVDGAGRYWVFSDAMPSVFDEDGDFERIVGRRGDGPGEFRSARYLWRLPGDSILVREHGPALHLFDPDLVFVRKINGTLLGSLDMAILDWPSNVVVNALDPRADRFGRPFHAVRFSTDDAEVVASFGETGDTVTQSSMYYLLPHALAESATGGYWSLAVGLYDITRWSTSHRREFTLERRPAWFPGRSDLGGGGRTEPPRPRCHGLSEDDEGLLWTFCLVASPGWRDAAGRAAEMLAQARASGATGLGLPETAFDDHLLYHTRIEVIDPLARRVVATHYVDARVTSVLPDRRAAVFVITPDGVPYVDIYRYTIRREPTT